jgi:hypothetical protein
MAKCKEVTPAVKYQFLLIQCNSNIYLIRTATKMTLYRILEWKVLMHFCRHKDCIQYNGSRRL